MKEHVIALQKAFAPYFNARYETDQRYAAMPAPLKNFVIFMTPCSGSVWISNVLTRHGGFGQTKEWFNPDHIAIDIAQTQSASLDRYLDQVRKLRQDENTGVFGAEISYFHLELIERLASFFGVFGPDSTEFFYLARRDLAAQAVSLYRAKTTQIWPTYEDHIESEPIHLPYNEAAISACVEHVLLEEEGFEKTFAEMNLRPRRLVFEDIVEDGADEVCRIFGGQVGVECHPAAPPTTRQRRSLAGDEDMADRIASSLALPWLRNRDLSGVKRGTDLTYLQASAVPGRASF